MAGTLLLSSVVAVVAWFLGCIAVMDHRYHKVKELLKVKIMFQKKKAVALVVFLLVGLLAGFFFYKYGWLASKIVRYLIIIYGTLVIAYIDKEEHLIPNRILLVLFAVRFVLLVIELVLYSYAIMEILASAFGGLVFGFVFFIIAYFISKKGIGMGDVKLIAVVGFYTGTSSLYAISLFSLIICALYSLVLMIRKKIDSKSFVAFGPFVAVGTFLTLLMGI